MEIDLKEQIVILDEAHNMEDSSRDAASGSLTTEQINQAIYNLQELCELLPLIIHTPHTQTTTTTLRDAASGSLTTEQINQVIYNLQELCELLPLIITPPPPTHTPPASEILPVVA